MNSISIDFDGVLHSYEQPWQGAAVIPDDPVPGAQAFCRAMLDAGWRVYVQSARCGQEGGPEAMRAWFAEHCFPDGLEIVAAKPPAHVYLDDRGWCFTGVFPTAEQIAAFCPWNKLEGRE